MLYTGIPLAAANYIFNAGVFISTNSGISTMLTNFNILYVYFISTIRYDESINLICLIGSFILVGSIYVVLFKKWSVFSIYWILIVKTTYQLGILFCFCGFFSKLAIRDDAFYIYLNISSRTTCGDFSLSIYKIIFAYLMNLLMAFNCSWMLISCCGRANCSLSSSKNSINSMSLFPLAICCINFKFLSWLWYSSFVWASYCTFSFNFYLFAPTSMQISSNWSTAYKFRW